ncbi:MAG: hypothetical protein JO235_21445 [Chroococcidiopsidaceae cyanobacterium CP_BM_RX_35]|nr:hypothetical protein [Chroococcidiopsidaceae cyanobacterium CP_BM_RX_35]
MRDLFYRLNHAGTGVDISTFSKACKSRQDMQFCRIYVKLIEQLKRQHPVTAQTLIPIDSTVISISSKLFWRQEYHQVKLMKGIKLGQGNLSEWGKSSETVKSRHATAESLTLKQLWK